MNLKIPRQSSKLKKMHMLRTYSGWILLPAVGRMVLLSIVCLLAVQVVFADVLAAAEPRKKSADAAQDNTGVASRRVLSITADMDSGSGEAVHITLSGNFPPVPQVIEGDEPRIICDFRDVRMAKTIQRTIPVNGKFIIQIRTGIHPPPDAKSRVVLDLVPKHDYEVEQLFYEKDNRYTMIIREKS